MYKGGYKLIIVLSLICSTTYTFSFAHVPKNHSSTPLKAGFSGEWVTPWGFISLQSNCLGPVSLIQAKAKQESPVQDLGKVSACISFEEFYKSRHYTQRQALQCLRSLLDLFEQSHGFLGNESASRISVDVVQGCKVSLIVSRQQTSMETTGMAVHNVSSLWSMMSMLLLEGRFIDDKSPFEEVKKLYLQLGKELLLSNPTQTNYVQQMQKDITLLKEKLESYPDLSYPLGATHAWSQKMASIWEKMGKTTGKVMRIGLATLHSLTGKSFSSQGESSKKKSYYQEWLDIRNRQGFMCFDLTSEGQKDLDGQKFKYTLSLIPNTTQDNTSQALFIESLQGYCTEDLIMLFCLLFKLTKKIEKENMHIEVEQIARNDLNSITLSITSHNDSTVYLTSLFKLWYAFYCAVQQEGYDRAKAEEYASHINNKMGRFVAPLFTPYSKQELPISSLVNGVLEKKFSHEALRALPEVFVKAIEEHYLSSYVASIQRQEDRIRQQQKSMQGVLQGA